MKYNVYFDIAAIILTAMLLLIVYLRRTYPTISCTLYKWMLWLNLVSSCADLFSAYVISYPMRFSPVTNFAINMLYLLSHNLTAVVFLVYVITLIRGNLGKRSERLIWLGATVLDILLILTTPITGFIFYLDENRNYCHGAGMPLLYLLAGFFLVYSLVLFIRHRNILSGFQMITNIVFLSLLIGAIVFQAFFPEYLIESFCAAIAFLMMNVALDNPAIYFYRNSVCYNQTAFETTVSRRLRLRSSFCLLALTFDDLPLFKSRFGDAGFDALVSRTIKDCHKLFGQKNVYFLSCDAFAIDSIPEEKLDAAVEELTKTVGRDLLLGKQSVSLTPHFCVFRHPGYAESAGDVTEAISDMLYDVYRKQEQTVIYIDSNLLERKHREDHVIHELHTALLEDSFEVFYQPILHQKTGTYCCAEALLRLNSPESGFISPGEFIPLAEKSGLILDIGEVAFEKVCRFWSEHDLPALGIHYLEVNLSMLQLQHRHTVERLVRIAEQYGVPPCCLNLEVTETAASPEEEKTAVKENMDYLMQKGFTFSLDDYGSGYATASYIAEMPFRIVKIDRDILWNAMKEQGFRVILENSIRLISAFGKCCVAEGVETEEMAALLTEQGCDFFQGYLYSKPLPGQDFLEFLQAHQK